MTIPFNVKTELFKESVLKLTCFEEGLMIDDILGATMVKVGELLLSSKKDMWLPLYYKEKKTAEVLVLGFH